MGSLIPASFVSGGTQRPWRDVARTAYRARGRNRSYIGLLCRGGAQLQILVAAHPASSHGGPYVRSDAIAAVGTLDESVALEHGPERFAQPRERDVHGVAVAERMVFPPAPHPEVEILEAHTAGAAARKLLEELQPLRWEGQIGLFGAHTARIEHHREIESPGWLFACVEDPPPFAVLDAEPGGAVEAEPRDPARQRVQRAGHAVVDPDAGARASSQEGLVPELRGRAPPCGPELGRSVLQVTRPLREEGADQVGAKQNGQVAVPLREGSAARDRAAGFARLAKPRPGLAARELRAGELVERSGASVPHFRACGGGVRLREVAGLQRTFRRAQLRICPRRSECGAGRRPIPIVERPCLDPRQRGLPCARESAPAAVDGL